MFDLTAPLAQTKLVSTQCHLYKSKLREWLETGISEHTRKLALPRYGTFEKLFLSR